ncbi:alcohol dehydrogenase catalytic domain-containing protein [Saccharopolyspora sp. ASAGF58]|uniref:alcohol dehydrogenase catalytic domain-containing protein n=1 Tax=Saccharopolyspora sp. ASAGF58 TaxID=2719023 RepID=UPI0014450A7B|nr:alcohol dehydrogenase catalytic domain-containing protein [Saccharopolyspora sp. ASAGF58]
MARVSVEDVPVQVPGPTDVLVRVEMCGICGTDIDACRFHPDNTPAFGGPISVPVILGHEASGLVVDVGELVTRVRPGDPVALESVLACSTCDTCLAGRRNQCENVTLSGLTAPGALAEFITVPQTACHRLNLLTDSGWDLDDVFLAGCLLEPLGCVFNALFVENRAVRPGENVLVHGLGPLGLFAGLLCRIAGATRIVGVDPLAERRHAATELGFDACLSPSETHNSDNAVTLLDADVHVETSGNPTATLPVIERHLRPGSRCVLISRTHLPVSIDPNPWVSSAARLVGARGHSGGIFPYLIRLFAAGRLNPRDLIATFLDLEDVPNILGQDTSTNPRKTVIRVGTTSPSTLTAEVRSQEEPSVSPGHLPHQRARKVVPSQPGIPRDSTSR